MGEHIGSPLREFAGRADTDRFFRPFGALGEEGDSFRWFRFAIPPAIVFRHFVPDGILVNMQVRPCEEKAGRMPAIPYAGETGAFPWRGTGIR